MTKVIESHPELDELLKEFKTETVAEEALRILEAIPEEMWFTGCYYEFGGVRRCAMGWMYFSKNKPIPIGCGGELPIAYKAHEFLNPKGTSVHHISGIASVNDGKNYKYQQPRPKQRVIALLNDMIKAGY